MLFFIGDFFFKTIIDDNEIWTQFEEHKFTILMEGRNEEGFQYEGVVNDVMTSTCECELWTNEHEQMN
jgi:hypothetical protein